MTIDTSAVARGLGITVNFKDLRNSGAFLLPQRVAVIGQGATATTYATTKAQYTSAFAVGTAYGFGSPLHLAAKQLFPKDGDGIGTVAVDFYPLLDNGAGVAASGTVTPSGSQTASGSYYALVNNIKSNVFTVAASDTVATRVTALTGAINAILDMPIIATDNTTAVGIAAKWKGSTGNKITISIVGPSLGTTWTIVQPASGATNPVVTAATSQWGTNWTTIVINCMESADTTTLDALSTFNEGKWAADVPKFFFAVNGNTDASSATATTVPDARKTDRTNVQICVPGSTDLPFVIAARAVARIARQANNNPPTDYGALSLTGLVPGSDSSQWDYPTKDAALKKGASTTDVIDGIVQLSDTITMYHPSGDPNPAFRYAVDLVKLQNVVYNIDLIFSQPEWDGAPLVPDNQPTTNPNARHPKSAVGEVNGVIDGLALLAILSDPAFSKALTAAVIDSGNPKRLNVSTTVKLVGNTNIIDVGLNFGFYFGTPAIAA